MAERTSGDAAPVREVLYWVISALVAYLSWKLVAPLLPALALAFGLAIAVRPLHRRLELKFASSGTVAALVIVILLIAIIAPATLLVTRVAREGLDAADRIRAAIQSGDLMRSLSRMPGVSSVGNYWFGMMDLDSVVRQFSGYFARGISAAISNSASIIAQICMALFALFFFLRDRALILGSIGGMLPLSAPEVSQVFKRIGDTIFASLYGNLAVKLIQGFLGGAMFWAVGLPAPVFWGSVMAVLAFVPFIGTGVVWGPAALYLFWHGSWIKAIVLAVWGGGIVSTIDNVIYPMIVGRELRLHTLAVFIAFIGGMSAFGVAGLVLGPAILALMATLIDIWRQRDMSRLPDHMDDSVRVASL